MKIGSNITILWRNNMALVSLNLRFLIGCKGTHFKTRTGYQKAKTLCIVKNGYYEDFNKYIGIILLCTFVAS